MELVYIYSLTDPRDEKIKYVGKAIDVNYRFTSHLWKNKNDKTEKNHWIQHLIKNGMKPILGVLDEVKESEWQFWERYWICQIKAWGFDLKNGDNGGLGFDRYNKKVKDKISKTLTGRSCPNFYVGYNQYDMDGNFVEKYESLKSIKIKYSLRMADSNISTAFRTYISALGFLWVKEGVSFDEWHKEYLTRKNIAKENKRKCASKIAGKYRTGLNHSEATKLKMSIAKLGKPTCNKVTGKKKILN